MPILLPAAGVPEVQNALPEPKRSTTPAVGTPAVGTPAVSTPAVSTPAVGKLPKPQIKPMQQQASSMGRLWFTPAKTAVEKSRREKPKREKVKADPAHVAAARELRDRWLERVNANPTAVPVAPAKYQVCKHLEAPQATPTPLLEAA